MGDKLGDVTGVMHYFGGAYEVLPTQAMSPGSGVVRAGEVTTLQGDGAHLEVAAYNVENLDPTDSDAKFAALAEDIAYNLGSPDIISLEEMQDADGKGTGSNLSGQATADKLIAAIIAAGGPAYVYVEVLPAGTTGGEANGNIRNGFLYNPERVDYVEGSARLIYDTDPTNGDAFNNSRRPLAVDFVFHGETVTTISVHNYARSGGDDLFGATQPAGISGDQRRTDQTAAINVFIEQLRAANPDAQVAVMGDFNGFQFETSLTQLETAGGLFNLAALLPEAERYSYVFEGNAQLLDHMLVSATLADRAQFDIVHLNTGNLGFQPTDHDALMSLLYVNTAPVGVADSFAGSEDTAIVAGGPLSVLANDTDKNRDALTATLVSGPANGLLTFKSDGSFTYVPNADFNGTDSFIYVTRDPWGEVSGSTVVTLNIAAVNDRPVGQSDTATVAEDGSVRIAVLANDSDKDGDALSIVLDGSRSALGASVSVEDGQIRYLADADAFDGLAAGAAVTDTVTYRVSDGKGGLSDPITVTVTVREAGDNRTLAGTNKGDAFVDAAGFDTVWFGGNGDDDARGGDGADTLYGENGRDRLDGARAPTPSMVGPAMTSSGAARAPTSSCSRRTAGATSSWTSTRSRIGSPSATDGTAHCGSRTSTTTATVAPTRWSARPGRR
jgi:VCBS repeat-containing protein